MVPVGGDAHYSHYSSKRNGSLNSWSTERDPEKLSEHVTTLLAGPVPESSCRELLRFNRVGRRYKPVHRLTGVPGFLRHLHRHNAIHRRELESRHRVVEDLAHDIDMLAVGIAAFDPVTIGGIDAAAIEMPAIRADPMFHPDRAQVDHR
jgi:hypothetical protein